MTRQILTISFVLAAAAAHAADAPAPPKGPPPIPTPGAEQKALDRLATKLVFEGTITPPAAMGMAPSKTTITMDCKKVAADMWIACDVASEPVDPKFPKFRAHTVLGYDEFAKEYRAMSATLQGVSEVMHGKLDGQKLVFLSDEIVGPTHKTKAKETWDLSDPKKIHMIEERSIDGGPFAVFTDMTSK